MNQVNALAKNTVDDFIQLCPPPTKRSAQRRLRQKRIQTALDQLLNKLKKDSQEHRLGLIGKIRLIYAIQNQMKIHQYESALMRQVITAMIFAVLSRG